MEVKNDINEQGHFIFCERHTPLKIRRVLEIKEKKFKEEIKRFCKALLKLTQSGKYQKFISKSKENSRSKH